MTDIYTTSIDYDKTATEIIYARTDSEKNHMAKEELDDLGSIVNAFLESFGNYETKKAESL